MSTLDTPVLVWMTVAIAAAIIEILIPHFGIIFVSLAGAAAAIAAYFALGVPAQAFVFDDKGELLVAPGPDQARKH